MKNYLQNSLLISLFSLVLLVSVIFAETVYDFEADAHTGMRFAGISPIDNRNIGVIIPELQDEPFFEHFLEFLPAGFF